jgi:PAS domain S-box-containing protein
MSRSAPTDPPPDASAPDTRAIVKRIVDRLPSLLGYWNRDLHCVFANAAYARWFGTDPGAMVGMHIRDLLGPDLYARNLPYIEGVLRGEPQVFERIVPGPDGVKRHSVARYEPDLQDGALAGFFVEVTEVSALKHAEQALRDSDQRFRALSEASPFGVYYANPQGQRLYANRRWLEIYGLSAENGLGDAWLSVLHPDDRDAAIEFRRTSLRDGIEFEREFRIVRPDGRQRTLLARGAPVRSDEGVLLGTVGAVEDITERREAEERLRASERFLDRTGRVARVGGFEIDLATRAVAWSAHTRSLHEVDDDFVLHFGATRGFYPNGGWQQLEAAVAAARHEGKGWDLELPFVTAKGRPLWVRVFGAVESENGVPVRVMGAFQDVTEHHSRQEALAREQALRLETERHAEALDRLLRERSEMLDVMAHEVRQPLNNASAALQGASSALGELGDGPAVERLQRAQSVIGRVLASIDNTLAVASLLARPGPLRRMDADVDTMLDVAIGDMPDTERVRIHVTRATDTRTVSMDPSLMRLALRNLLSNALRYSPPEAPVRVTISDSDDPLALVFEVADTGPGLAPDALTQLFERRRPRSIETAGPHGLGLGLYIVRRVMELHAGRVDLVRNGPTGATFRLLLVESPED